MDDGGFDESDKNAMEHSRGGTIHCEYFQNPLYTDIRIWDEGRAFCPEDIPHLFERDFTGAERRKDGSGIGLALSQSLYLKCRVEALRPAICRQGAPVLKSGSTVTEMSFIFAIIRLHEITWIIREER